MNIVYSKQFLKDVSNLPVQTQKKLDRLLAILSENPFHPLLHTKPLSGVLQKFYSFRITREWRIIFIFETKDTIRVTTVGHRKDVYQ